MGRWQKARLAGLVRVAVAIPAGIVVAGGNSSTSSVATQRGAWLLSAQMKGKAMLAARALLLWLAARIYNRAVLRMGAPIKLLQAVRLAR
jgi:hypothetical protein